MKIGVVGLGKLGLPLALVFAKAGFHVEGIELSRDRIKDISANKSVSEPKVNNYFNRHGGRLFPSKYYHGLSACSVVFVVVQTPSLANHVFDTQYVTAAVLSIHKVNKDCLIVISSTVPPKTCDALTKLHKRIAYNPEFIKQGSIIDDFERPKFIMIGAYGSLHCQEVSQIWQKVVPKYTPIHCLPPLEAEITKLALNVSFCKDITFANVVGEFCESMGANSKAVMDVVNLDKRSYQAGLGYGGVCFPRDTKCFQALTPQRSNAFGFIENLENCNLNTICRYVREILNNQSSVALIGLTYKRGVPILEDSHGLRILVRVLIEIERQTKKPAPNVYAYDEGGIEVYDQIRLKGVCYCDTMKEALEDAETVFFGLPIKAPPKLLKGKRVIDPWGLNK